MAKVVIALEGAVERSGNICTKGIVPELQVNPVSVGFTFSGGMCALAELSQGNAVFVSTAPGAHVLKDIPPKLSSFVIRAAALKFVAECCGIAEDCLEVCLSRTNAHTIAIQLTSETMRRLTFDLRLCDALDELCTQSVTVEIAPHISSLKDLPSALVHCAVTAQVVHFVAALSGVNPEFFEIPPRSLFDAYICVGLTASGVERYNAAGNPVHTHV